MALRILVTNDDSISSPVLLPLVQWARKLGEVTCVVPKYEQSGKSHSIELRNSFEVAKVTLGDGTEAYTVDSAPADCVRYAILGMGMEFDLVISGINKGLNIGIDTLYSGTAAAIFEAGCCQIPAVAISTDPDSFDDALSHLDRVQEFFLEHKLFEKHSLYNVNIPVGTNGIIRITRQGGRFYSDDFVPADLALPQGRHLTDEELAEVCRKNRNYNGLIRPLGKVDHIPSGQEDLDTDAVLTYKYISISPMTIVRTRMDVFEELKQLNQ